MVMCFEYGCNHYSEQKRCKFFHFPADDRLRAKWIAAISRRDKIPHKGTHICSCHFKNGSRESIIYMEKKQEVSTSVSTELTSLTSSTSSTSTGQQQQSMLFQALSSKVSPGIKTFKTKRHYLECSGNDSASTPECTTSSSRVSSGLRRFLVIDEFNKFQVSACTHEELVRNNKVLKLKLDRSAEEIKSMKKSHSYTFETNKGKELNFKEICRCCKRTESRMISIFDGTTDRTYPPVDEMLKCIASLKVSQNDGLPSLVCTSCLNNIKDAFTFIKQIIQIDEELSQMLATREHDDTPLSQDINETNQFISTDYVKSENADVEEPMLNFYQHGSVSTVSSFENIDLEIKLEPDQDQEATGHVAAAEVKNEEISNLADPLYLAPTPNEEKQSSSDVLSSVKLTVFKCKLCDFTNGSMYNLKKHLQSHSKNKPFTCSKCKNVFAQKVYLVNHWRTCQGDTKSARYKGDVSKQVISLNLEDLEDPLKIKEYYTSAEVDYDLKEPRTEIPNKLAVYKCKLCDFTGAPLTRMKRHLLTHCMDKPFACLKCNQRFSAKHRMLLHCSHCNGKDKAICDTCQRVFINEQQLQTHKLLHTLRIHKGPVKSLTFDEVDDPRKMKKYYTVAVAVRSDVQNVDDD